MPTTGALLSSDTLVRLTIFTGWLAALSTVPAHLSVPVAFTVMTLPISKAVGV